MLLPTVGAALFCYYMLNFIYRTVHPAYYSRTVDVYGATLGVFLFTLGMLLRKYGNNIF